MVRIVVLALLLSACASNADKPKFGKEVEAPCGWKYTYCPSHRDELGCNNAY
jgi:hypothetical protein